MNTGIFYIEVSYFDEHNVNRFTIIIKENPSNINQEAWYIQMNILKGEPFVTIPYGLREKDMDIKTDQFLRKIDQFDFTDIEKSIKQIEKRIVIIGK